MVPILRIKLLGVPEVTIDDRLLTFRRRKALGVLAYLAITGGSVARETLANLLAGESEQQLALQNVRNVLADLREQLDPYLWISRPTIALNSETPFWLDVAELERLLAAPEMDDTAVDRVTTLYAGDLLAGFTVRNAPAFEAWLDAERKRLRQLVMFTWKAQLDRAIRSSETERAGSLAERILAADPFDEAMQRTAMRVLEQTGHPDRALRLHEYGRARLPEAFEATPERLPLSDRRRSGAVPATPARDPMTRDADLALLIESLANPDCRLITLLAPHHSQAVALARRLLDNYHQLFVAQQSLPFVDGFREVSLAAELQPDAFQSLSETIKDQMLLLFLADVTPTETETERIAGILRAAPRITLLVVARRRLYLQEEWVLDVE